MASVTSLPGTGVDDGAVGSITWSNPGNITADDGSVATATMAGTAATHYAKGTAYTFSSIPSTATIVGIELYLKKRRTGGTSNSIVDNSIRLVKSGTVVGNDYADTTNAWTQILTEFVYGGPTDLWGTTWTPSDWNSSTSGAVFSCKGNNAGSDRIANLDDLKLVIYYTTGSGLLMFT